MLVATYEYLQTYGKVCTLHNIYKYFQISHITSIHVQYL